MYKIISKMINIFSFIFLMFKPKYDILLLQKFGGDKNLNFILIEKNVSGKKIKYVDSVGNGIIQLVKDIYNIQVSKTIIVDSYSLGLSNVNRFEKKLIIQIWHALGALKKFGFQSLDTSNGRSAKMAFGLNMHKNYTFVVSPGSMTTPIFKSAFKSEVKEFCLPVMENTSKSIYKDIKKVLYLPTYRSGSVRGYQNIVEVLDSNYELLYKPHPNDFNEINDLGIEVCKLSTHEAIKECDVLITDYSAACFEAYLLGKSVLFYLWDFDEYNMKRGLNVDYTKFNNVCCDAANINSILSNMNVNNFELFLNANNSFIEYLNNM